MGNPSNALDSQEIVDGPQTVVTLTRGFFIGKYEATQGEYLAVTGSNPSEFRNGTPSCCGGTGGVVTNELVHPVERVNWFDATNYCARLTDRERVVGRTPAGWVYRLPTEAEWEYACRGGTTSAFHYGPALRSGMANFFGQHEYEFSAGETTNPTGIYFGRTTVVGSYEANGWGLYDMHGNVFEWCWDWFSNPLAGGRVIDPQGPSIGSRRVIRGGSWATIGRACLSAYRPSFFFPVDRSRDFGFRVVLSPVQ
jgi:formylglycine-generating enzyme required for sulfatase activity